VTNSLNMKNLLGLLVVVLMLNSCNDGNLTVNTINFNAVQTAKCSNNQILYKLNGSEVLLLEMPESQNAFPNISGVAEFNINTSNRARYRLYNGTIGVDNICETFQPATPTLSQEWIARAGKIEITTSAVYGTTDATTAATRISRYNHNIIFKNVTFSTPNGDLVYDSFNFGDYLTTANVLTLSFPPELVRCDTNLKIYTVSNNRTESMELEGIDPSLIQSVAGTRKQLLGSTTNKLVFRTYSSALVLPVSDYFCSTKTPTINEEWTGVDGVTDLSGIVEVTTVTNGSGFSHTIRLKKITFKRGTSTFYYGNDILFGELITAN